MDGEPAPDAGRHSGDQSRAGQTRRRKARRRRRWNVPLLLILAGVLAAWAVYTFVWPWVVAEYRGAGPGAQRMLRDPVTRSVDFVIGGWFFVLGSVLGSFLNVVAARWPRGEGFVSADSHCPRCGHRILRRDNIPILGWVLLRGRCRFCRLPIPARYCIVEAAFGGIFLWIAVRMLFSGGASIPVRQPNSFTGVTWTILWPQWDLISLYAWHMGMFSLLVVIGLMVMDRYRIPWGVWGCAAILAAVPALLAAGIGVVRQALSIPFWEITVLPVDLQPVSWWLPWQRPMPGAQPDAIGLFTDSVIYLALGMMAGGLAAWVTGTFSRQCSDRAAGVADTNTLRGGIREGAESGPAWLLAWLTLGGVLGWQAVPGLLICWVGLMPLWRLVPVVGRTGPGIWLTASALLHLGFWRGIYQLLFGWFW